MLYDELKAIRAKGAIPFHMPGSKGGDAIEAEYKKNIFDLDYTELKETDNLAKPEGILKKAQKNAAEIYGAKESFFLVNGSSGGIMAAIHYLSQYTKKIIFARDCHISVLNAIRLFDITPVFTIPPYIDEWGIAGPVDIERLKRQLDKHKDAKAVFITSPNYYGISSDLEAIYRICQRRGVLLLVDAAHGAHFNFSENLPTSASRCSDISIMSIHKTMPAPSQAAIMNISRRIDGKEMKKSINMFQTTSPSYITMAYIDYAINYMYKNGEEIYSKLKKYADDFENTFGENVLAYPGKDFTRMVFRGGKELGDFLEENYNIALEMTDVFNVVAIAGHGNSDEHFKALKDGLTNYYVGHKKLLKYPDKYEPLTVPMYIEHIEGKKGYMKIDWAEGYVAAEMVAAYPPGIPLLLEGEVISKKKIKQINDLLRKGHDMIGVSDGMYLYVYHSAKDNLEN